jgi:hypothetical protein
MEASKAAPDRVVYRIKMQDGLGNCQMLETLQLNKEEGCKRRISTGSWEHKGTNDYT